MTPSEMSTTRAPSIVNTEVDKASVAATSAIEIPEFADSVRDTGPDKKIYHKRLLFISCVLTSTVETP